MRSRLQDQSDFTQVYILNYLSYTEKISHKNEGIKEVRMESRETKGIIRNK